MSYSYLDLAYDVLKQASTPMIYQEIWQFAVEKGIANKLETNGKTPWQSHGARLYVEVRDNGDSKILKVGTRPTRFFLKERQAELPPDAINKLEKEEAKKGEKRTEYGCED